MTTIGMALVMFNIFLVSYLAVTLSLVIFGNSVFTFISSILISLAALYVEFHYVDRGFKEDDALEKIKEENSKW
jgi:hypothetical protein